MNTLLSRIPKFLPTALVIVAILYLTLFPHPVGSDSVQLFEGADKVIHAIMFGALCGTVIFDFWRIHRPLSLSYAILVAAVVSSFGALIEMLQDAMDLGRSGDIYDLIADAAGAFLAVALTRKWHKQ